jgi:hypothetical protein
MHGFHVAVPEELTALPQTTLDQINASGRAKIGALFDPFQTGFVDASGAVRVLVSWTDKVQSSADLATAQQGAGMAAVMAAATQPEDRPAATIDPTGTTLTITRKDQAAPGVWVNTTSVIRLGRGGAAKLEFFDPPLRAASALPDAWRPVVDSIRFDPGYEHVPPPSGTNRPAEPASLSLYASLLVPMIVLGGAIVLGAVVLTTVRVFRVRRTLAARRGARDEI